MILQLIVDEVKHEFPDIKKLVAKVKPENIASEKLFESEEYDMKYSCYDLDTNRVVLRLSNTDAILNVDIYERRGQNEQFFNGKRTCRAWD